ncbi:MAG: PrsW family intramembrane metalloprotease [Myxococcales bacterium]|nr:PrsW family intramembrane metalloprotease [Myxococcales bacterium]
MTSDKFCCVCNRPLNDDEAKELGGRFFCEKHHQRAFHNIGSRWGRTGLLEILIIALSAWAIRWFGGTQSTQLSWVLTVGMAALLTLLWMRYIYRLDRVEPEPLPLVFGVLILGGLIAKAVGEPLVHDLFRIQEWRHIPPFAPWVTTIMVVGVVQQLCNYLALRYSVYFTRELDEPLDAVVYSAAAGLGIATVSNVEFALSAEASVPFNAAVAMASHSLIHVAAATVLGYGMARARFWTKHRGLWACGCFLLSAVINGGAKHLAVLAGIHGGDYDPWLTLAVAGGAAAFILVSIDIVTARLSVESFSGVRHDGQPHPKRSYTSFVAPTLIDPPMWVVALIPLIGAIAFRDYVAIPEKDVRVLAGQISLHLPDGWAGRSHADGYIAEEREMAAFSPQVRIRTISSDKIDASLSLAAELNHITSQESESDPSYRVISQEMKKAFGGHRSAWAWFARVQEPGDMMFGGSELPVVIAGYDIVVEGRGAQIYHIHASAPASDFEATHSELLMVLDSVKLK